jgi:hypothetical protein
MSTGVADYFACNSEIAKAVRDNPGSAHPFELLYTKEAELPIDRYFLNSMAGHNVYLRLLALERTFPAIVGGMLDDRRLLIENAGSGPGHDMIGVMRTNPDLASKVHIRNIDPDVAALKIGQEEVERLGLSKSFGWEAGKFNEVEARGADLVPLIGVLCPLDMRTCRLIMRVTKRFATPRCASTPVNSSEVNCAP